MNQYIAKLIASHKASASRLESEGSQPKVKVSKFASFLGSTYEKVRNAIEENEPHLRRITAIKRISKRVDIFKSKNTGKAAEKITKEIIWAKYLDKLPIPIMKIKFIQNIIIKYKALISEYRKAGGVEPSSKIYEILYSIFAFEVERVLYPYHPQDILIDFEYNFINGKGLLASPYLDSSLEPVQTYIAVHRANTKSDDNMILFHLFYFKFPFWGNPNQEQIKFVAQNLDSIVNDIYSYVHYEPERKKFKEVVRQSIPFKILDLAVKQNLEVIETALEDDSSRDAIIDEISKKEYVLNKKRLRSAIIGSIIYIFITKVALAFLIEIPYEIRLHGEPNYFTLGINILFPTFTMFVVAMSFRIPNEQNTAHIKKMIKSIISKDKDDDRVSFINENDLGKKSKFVIKSLYYSLFILIFAGIAFILNLLNYNIVSMAIFFIFFSTIFFVANRLRNTATELKVIDTSPSVFSPIIDMISIPLLMLGSKLSEGASNLNLIVIVFDKIIERPVKSFIRGFEHWNDYLRDAKEQIV